MNSVSGKSVAEFFAGIGLMRMGLERDGWSVQWANDIDAEKREMYGHHFGESEEFHLGDVHQVDATTIPDVRLATASFPCTDLSLAGARKGLAGAGSGAFWGFIDALRSMGHRVPEIVLLENVTGFLTSHQGADFRDACIALNDLGYEVDAFVIDAERFVPQSRQRLFVVGVKSSATSVRVREDSGFFADELRPRALADFILWNPEIRWRIRPLPRLPKRTTSLESIIEELSPNSKYWWSRERAEYLLNQMSEKHREVADRMIAGDRTCYGTVFRRVRKGKSMAELRTDGIAGCLRTPKGGSARQILFCAGKGSYAVRLLTPRECARLMGAPDFRIDPERSLNQALFGFGDAVCVSVVEWISKNYLSQLLDEIEAGSYSEAVSYGGTSQTRRSSRGGK